MKSGQRKNCYMNGFYHSPLPNHFGSCVFFFHSDAFSLSQKKKVGNFIIPQTGTWGKPWMSEVLCGFKRPIKQGKNLNAPKKNAQRLTRKKNWKIHLYKMNLEGFGDVHLIV